MDQTSRHRVVIVGGGFGGLFAAKALRRSHAVVTLVDHAEHHLFQPLLHQCATGILSEGQIAAPLRDVLKRHRDVEFILAEVVDIDPSGRRVTVERPDGQRVELPYDDLIVAAGVRQSYFGHDEFARWAPGVKTLADALSVRRRVFSAFEMAETAADPAERRRMLTFALVGAGPTGVELAGQVRELVTRTLRAEFHHIRPEHARVLLFDAGHAPLAAFGVKPASKAAKALQGLGVEQHMRSIVTFVDSRGVVVREPCGATARCEAGTVLWTAGVEAPPIAARLAEATGARRDRAGRIRVTAELTVPGHPEISVIGDVMSLGRLPGVAEVAMQTGLYAGRRIRRRMEGDQWSKPFHYRDLGSAAYLARGRAVVTVGRLLLSGFAGRLAWMFIHVAFLTGFRNRFTAVLTWLVALASGARRERAFLIRETAARPDVAEPGFSRPLLGAVLPTAR
jgi:NADH dehydrogenase